MCVRCLRCVCGVRYVCEVCLVCVVCGVCVYVWCVCGSVIVITRLSVGSWRPGVHHKTRGAHDI